MRLTEGSRLGPYEVIGLLGTGGMGEVYRARDPRLGREVAVKVLPGALAGDPDRVRRFEHEARAAGSLDHPNILAVHDVGSHKGCPYVVSELLDGETVRDRLRTARLTPRKAIDCAVQIAEGLAAAHRKGIVHRDLKPENLFMTQDGRVKILDFGLAKLRDHEVQTSPDAATRSQVTHPGVVLGTVGYMSPEQVRGQPADQRSDIFALGAVLYEMLSGQRAFRGQTEAETLAAILNDDPPGLSTAVSPGLERIVRRCLEKRARERFDSANDVAFALQAVADTASLGAASFEVARRRRRSVAVLGFKNLSRREEAAWLSTALSEMLTMELAAGEQVRTVPGETVARVKIELSLPDTDALAKDTLARLRTNLGTDLVVLGSYFAAGAPAAGKVRLDMRVQDTAEGETVALLSEYGTEPEFLDLVARAGLRLRERLGIAALSSADRDAIQTARPSSSEAVRLYAEGLRKLRLFDALGAVKLLKRAVTIESGHALAHSALAEAWSALGYDTEAASAAKRAFELSAKLPREERLLIEGRHDEATKNWERAIETYRALWTLFPDNLDYGLRLVKAQTTAGTTKEAFATVEDLRMLSAPASEDPRIDLAEAQAAAIIGDPKRRRAAAAAAARKGEALEARLIVAWARFHEGTAFRMLGELRKATTALQDATRIFKEVGDRAGLARAVSVLGIVLVTQGELPRGMAAFEKALAIQRQIGHRSGAAITLLFRGAALWERDLPAARKDLEASLRIAREVGDQRVVMSSLSGIAGVLADQGRLSEGKRRLERHLKVMRERGYKWSVATTVTSIADILQRQGDVLKARDMYEESLTLFREIGAKLQIALVLRGIADVLAAQDALAASRRSYEKALALRTELGERGAIAEARSALAALSIEEGRLRDAKDLARRAANEFRRTGRRDAEAAALNVLARAFIEARRSGEARRALARALALSAKSRNVELRLSLAVTAARVQAGQRQLGVAAKGLQSVIAKASKAGFGWVESEARLAMGEMEIQSGHTTSGRVRLAYLEKQARRKGLLLIARKAAAARSVRPSDPREEASRRSV